MVHAEVGRLRGTTGIVAAVALAAVGCGSNPAPVEPPAPAAIVVPPGVDSSVAAHADSLAAASFVDVARQEESTALQREAQDLVARSDSVWSLRPESVDPVPEVTAEDSLEADAAATEGGHALVRLDALLRESGIDDGELAIRTARLLDSAQAALERAFALNPFDARSRLWLARVYELQARRLGQLQAYARAVEELDKLARLTPDEHAVFAMLANNHLRLEEWEPAAANYRRATRVYLATHDLVADGPLTLDSALVFSYLRAEADVHVRRRATEAAVGAFGEALRYARTPDDSAYVDGELAWIDWDEGNIASALARDSLLQLEAQGALDAAAAGYGALLPTLTAPRAIDETEWRLAIVEYNLDRGESAAERLRRLVARTAVDAEGVPVDSSTARYVEDYGTVCLNLGRRYLHDRSDNRTALKYFDQATRVRWSGQPVAHLEIASLVENNVAAALEHANQSLASEETLAADQRERLYRLLMGLHRRAGDFEAARRFRDAYRALQSR